MRTTRRARPKKPKKIRRARRSTPGILIRQIIRKRPRARKSTEILGLRCRVMSVMGADEVLVLAEAYQGRQIAIPVASHGQDGSQLRALGLKEGQDVWLSLRA